MDKYYDLYRKLQSHQYNFVVLEQLIRKLTLHNFHNLTFILDGITSLEGYNEFLATGSWDKTVKIWNWKY